jgi:hypothetical protein
LHLEEWDAYKFAGVLEVERKIFKTDLSTNRGQCEGRFGLSREIVVVDIVAKLRGNYEDGARFGSAREIVVVDLVANL